MKRDERPKPVAKDGNVDESNRSAVAGCSNVGGDTRRRRLKGVQETKLSCEDVCLLRFLQRDVSRAFFYRTLNLKRFGGFQRRQRSDHQPLRRENEIDGGLRVSDKATDSAAGGSKVLPVRDSNQSSAGNGNDKRPELGKNGKKKGICRVKELLRWPGAAQLPRIDIVKSISLHVQSDQQDDRTETWITTDSEFVVLEVFDSRI
ncbi:UNVERIFIED_CONTAM: hypothetical protein Sradi_0435700 [Sesamum radiatum]|uniref:Uncharacterized protein n=1 Tax=Sesamum radiatum TaxID=300843 RepID=A0AAW2W6H8_SESRA